MVAIGDKPDTLRTASAKGLIQFSSRSTPDLIRSSSMKKGDVLALSRVASIMAVKSTATLIPLAHPIPITSATCDLTLLDEAVEVSVTVSTFGKTGVEMEAITGVMGGLVCMFDMCKAVDKGMRIGNVRVTAKTGGNSGDWGEDV